MQPAALKGFRLSIQQARLWTVQGKSLAYRTLCRVRIEGRLDLEIFQLALQKLVARHAILRTQLYCMPGMDMPMQVVANEDTIARPLVSLQDMELSQQENQVDGYAKNALETPFDLEQGPLLRYVLLRLSASSHILLISLPAFCADAATPKYLIAELAQVYDLCLEGKDLADDPLQYADVSAWQDELLEEEDAGEQRLFWRRIDLSSLDTMHLPFEMRARRDRSSKQDDLFFTPQVVEVQGVANWPAQLQALLQRADVSLEAFLLTCWQVIIWRLTGQTPVLVGVECDGRYHEELSGAPGPYSLMVPISISLAEKLPFERVLLLVHSFVEEAKKRQIYFSWPSLFSRAEGEPDTSFFPISFAYNEWPASIHARDLIFCMEQSTSCLEPFALKLHAWHVGQELHLQLHFDPRRLSFSSMQRLAKGLYTLVQGTFIQPQACVDALPVLPLEDQQDLRNRFTVPSIPTSFQTLSQAFEVQAERHPRQVAVVCEGEQLTYYQLNIYANRLAHTLQRLGVGANVLVGLYVERSVHMLVGMLAILKAGGAYVPLDPDQPAARLSYQLHDLQTPILLTQDHLQARLPAWNGQVLCLDKPGSWGNHELEHNLPPQSGAQDLAYVIYTSGSTGVPKGVMIRHRSVMNYTAALCELLATQPGLQFATVSTLAADLGNTSIFCSLASGGCLHILNYATVTLGEAFADYTAQHPIDVLKIVPSHLSALLASCGGRSILPRKYLVLGGEALSYELLRQLEAQPGTCCLLNHYGPTETTVGALVNVLGELGAGTRIYDENKNEAATVPIGRPIAGMEAYILDQFRQMVPVGVTGELYLGGVGLAVGYWQQPGQTQERFVEHPWSDEPGARLYRTGDLARYCDDGTIEFGGRVDSQVKLRGYRIEPGEIEAVLRSHPTIRENVVVLREDIPGDRRLVAYIVAQPPVPDEEELRHFIGEQLPGYMVPSSFVFLRVLPLNANGKVDRHMLPPPATIEDQKATTYQAPRTPVEEIVVGIWKSVLQVKQVGIYDNFSSLGGHSLLATQIISRICSALEVNVPLRYLFEFPTVAGLSERIEQIQRSGGDVKSLPLVPVPRTGKLPLSFAQQRLWFLDQLDSEHAAYLIPSVRRFQGALDVAALERSLAELVRRHEVLRTTFDGRAGQPVQIIHTANMLRLPVVDLRGLVQEEERAGEARRLARQ